MAFRAVILDVDGTLVDSNDHHAWSWCDALSEFDMPRPFDEVRRLIGMGGDKLLPTVTGIEKDTPQGKELSERRKQIFHDTYLPQIEPVLHAREAVLRMKEVGLRIVVASSAEASELGKLLEIANVADLLEDHTSSDDAERSKPDPDIVSAALAKLELPANEAVMIGDTPYDVEAARQAGVATIAVRSGGWDDEGLKGAIAIYDDLAALLRNFDESPLAIERD